MRCFGHRRFLTWLRLHSAVGPRQAKTHTAATWPSGTVLELEPPALAPRVAEH